MMVRSTLSTHSANMVKAKYVSQNSEASTTLSSAFSDSISDCSLTPRSGSKVSASMPSVTALWGTCGQPVQMKNTFLHVVIPDDAQPAMHRSMFAPSLLTQAEMRETTKSRAMAKSGETAESEVMAESELGKQDVKVWASREEREVARREMIYLHKQGVCRPCLYFAFKADSCRNGDDCEFCHLCAREDVAWRRKQRKMQTRRAMMNAMRKESGALFWARRKNDRLISQGLAQEKPAALVAGGRGAATPFAARPCAPGRMSATAPGKGRAGPPATSPFHGQPRASQDGHHAARVGRAALSAKFTPSGPVRT
jgi:hypothetical protein